MRRSSGAEGKNECVLGVTRGSCGNVSSAAVSSDLYFCPL